MLQQTSASGHLDEVVLSLWSVVLVVGNVEGVLVVGLGWRRRTLLFYHVDDAGPETKETRLVKTSFKDSGDMNVTERFEFQVRGGFESH